MNKYFFFILEQSCPLRPKSQKHVPLVVSQIPASLQLFGQVHSKKYYLYLLCIAYCLALFTAPGILARYILPQTFWPVDNLAPQTFWQVDILANNHYCQVDKMASQILWTMNISASEMLTCQNACWAKKSTSQKVQSAKMYLPKYILLKY